MLLLDWALSPIVQRNHNVLVWLFHAKLLLRMACGHTDIRNIIYIKVMFPICIFSCCSSSLHGILPLDSVLFLQCLALHFFQHNIYRNRYNVYQELIVSLYPWRAACLQRNLNSIWKTTQYYRGWLTAPKPSKTSDGYSFYRNTNEISFSDFKRAGISFFCLDFPWMVKYRVKCL